MKFLTIDVLVLLFQLFGFELLLFGALLKHVLSKLLGRKREGPQDVLDFSKGFFDLTLVNFIPLLKHLT